MKEDKAIVESSVKDKVEVTFSVDLPEPTFGTKAMSDNPEVQNLYVAVFGGSGFLKEYVKAEAVNATTNYNTDNPTKYRYKVTLSLTDSDVKIHFIANGPDNLPFRNEDEVIASLLKTGDEDAYWQRIEVPGIRAKKDSDGNYLDESNNIIDIDNPDVYPVIDPTTLTYFEDIPLVRNFARIKVSAREGSGFSLKGFTIVNKPKSGTVAPYDRNNGVFVKNYQDKEYQALRDSYAGNLPASVEIDKTIPEDESAYTMSNKYMYERPVPSSDPTMVIIFGTFEGKDYFYRVDLMDDNGYYPIFRNFEYSIVITDVVRAGAPSAQEAATSAGSGDVSTDVNATHLTDVSDGKARIYVEYTEKTIVGQQYVTLKYKFVPDVTSPNTVKNDDVHFTLKNSDDDTTPPFGDVIGSDWNKSFVADSAGWRKLRFKTTEPGNGIKTQDIKVTGIYNGGASKLYRIVTYKLMNKQSLEVVCVPNEVPRIAGEQVDVVIKLPKDLPRSLFPLHLKLEADKLSITPDGDNLPVNPGTSIVEGSTKASYQFVKTLSKAEYDALQDTASTSKVFVTCHFRTSRDNSAGTSATDKCTVYVDNEYFIKNSGYFTNYDLREFLNVSLNPKNASAEGETVTLKFDLDTELPDVYITLNGLVPFDESQLHFVSGTTYRYSPGHNSNAQIALKTIDAEGLYSAALSALHYKDAFVANLSYVNPGFTTESLTRGVGQNVGFEFSYVDIEGEPLVEDVIFDLKNLVPNDGQGFTKNSDGTWTYSPSSTARKHTIAFKTEKYAEAVSVSMRGEHYSSAGPIELAAPTLTVMTQALAFSGNNSPDNGTQVVVFTTSGVAVATFTVNGNGYNSAAFDIDLTKFKSNENVYFSFTRITQDYWYGTTTTTYYTNRTYTLTELENARNNRRLNIQGYTTNKPSWE